MRKHATHNTVLSLTLITGMYPTTAFAEVSSKTQ